jgi:hypothetical protein
VLCVVEIQSRHAQIHEPVHPVAGVKIDKESTDQA